MNPVAVGTIGAIVGCGIGALWSRISRIDKRVNRLALLDAKVDALLKAAGVVFDPLDGAPIEVREALERGDKILAIQRYRESTGKSLLEAKNFVDEARRRMV